MRKNFVNCAKLIVETEIGNKLDLMMMNLMKSYIAQNTVYLTHELKYLPRC